MQPLYPGGHWWTYMSLLDGSYWLHFANFLPGNSLCRLWSSAFLRGPSSVQTKQLWPLLLTAGKIRKVYDDDIQQLVSSISIDTVKTDILKVQKADILFSAVAAVVIESISKELRRIF